MKKTLSTFMSIILLFATISCSYNDSNIEKSYKKNDEKSSKKQNKYFQQKIFKSIKETNSEFYYELVNSTISKEIVKGVEITYIQLKNGYFIDDNVNMVYSEINKNENTITIHDFTENKKTKINLTINENGIYNGINENQTPKVDQILSNEALQNNQFQKCRDNAGFAICYAAVLISAIAIAASDGPLPLMDGLAISYAATATAGCVRSNC